MPVKLTAAVFSRFFAAMNAPKSTVAVLCLTICFTSLLLTVFAAASSDNIKCLTPNSIEGFCINLQLCPSIYEISNTNNRTLTLNTLLYLVNSQCGFNGTTPKVCCPLTDPAVNSFNTLGLNSETSTTESNLVSSGVQEDNKNQPVIINEAVKCVTPNSTEGLCINLQSCPSIYEVSSDYNTTLTLDTLTFLIQSQCGFNGTTPKVCCPITDPAVDSFNIFGSNSKIETTTDTNFVTSDVKEDTENQPVIINEVVKCVTPNSTEGLCVNLQSCPSIYQVSSDYNATLTLDTFTFLIHSQCGFNGSTPKVCCPFTDPAIASNYVNNLDKTKPKATTESNFVNGEVQVMDQQPLKDEPCLTPNATQGLCIQLELCPAIYNISSDSKANITLETMIYLKNSLCGFIGRKPKVCCSLADPLV